MVTGVFAGEVIVAAIMNRLLQMLERWVTAFTIKMIFLKRKGWCF